jgi:hypothetical protein
MGLIKRVKFLTESPNSKDFGKTYPAWEKSKARQKALQKAKKRGK